MNTSPALPSIWFETHGSLPSAGRSPRFRYYRHGFKSLCDLLLYGNADLNISTNRMIIEATISLIEKTRRFG